jgi:hypothetical protein
MEYYSFQIESWERWNTQLFVSNILNENAYEIEVSHTVL